MMFNKKAKVLGVVVLLIVCVGVALAAAGGDERVASDVELVRTPDGGIQPQAVVDERGTVHLIYFKGDPKGGDVYYARRAPGDAAFSKPIRVNSEPGTAIAMGTIRGAHIAVGRGGRVYVTWNGVKPAVDGKPGTVPVWYTRMNDQGTGFEPQRNLITWAYGIDGGGGIAADREGNVYVLWHGGAYGKGEAERAVYLAYSDDDGRSFARERRISPTTKGVCGCCSLRAFADEAGNLYVVFRDAGDGVHRNTDLLVSMDRGETFSFATVQPWKLNACPMSSASIAEDARGTVLAWQRKEQVYYTHVQPGTTEMGTPQPAPGTPGERKHPVLVGGRDGKLLFAWTEGTGWSRGGSLHWQEYDREGKPVGSTGSADGVPAWSLATGYVNPEGAFVLVY
ncbi:MAG TPA: sialidase family protein [Rhodothermales bacterium]|nr:sialidase family protein [Rhodothermales bacterium]